MTKVFCRACGKIAGYPEVGGSHGAIGKANVVLRCRSCGKALRVKREEKHNVFTDKAEVKLWGEVMPRGFGHVNGKWY